MSFRTFKTWVGPCSGQHPRSLTNFKTGWLSPMK
jgi:hypothetical protein